MQGSDVGERGVSSTAGVAQRNKSFPSTTVAASQNLSLYEDLLRYHQENPDDEDQDGEKLEVSTEDGDLKPAARPTTRVSQETRRKSKTGVYRVPVSREYFAAKDRLGSPSSSSSSPYKLTTISPDEQSISKLAEDPWITMGEGRGKLQDLPLPFLDTDFHDTAEDEALARQLQAEEEERTAISRRDTFVSMPSLGRTPSPKLPTSRSYDSIPLGIAKANDVIATPLGGIAKPKSRLLDHLPGASFYPTFDYPKDPVKEHEAVINSGDEIAKQEALLRRIREENERKQMEWAMKESQRETPQVPRITDVTWDSPRTPSPSKIDTSRLDWEATQRAALEEYARQQKRLYEQQRKRDNANTTGVEDLSSRSPPGKEQLLQQGKEETAMAILLGKAVTVKCQCCDRRLQAPAHYSLVYCPKCGTVSPVASPDSKKR